MNWFRIVGVFVAVLGAAIVIYSLSDFIGFFFRIESAGIGVLPISSLLFGVLLVGAGLYTAIARRTLR